MRSVVAKLCRLDNKKPGCTGTCNMTWPVMDTEDGGPNRPMNDVVSLQDYRDGKQKALKTGHLDAVKDGLRARGNKRRRPVSFDRGELSTLLSLYSEQVAAGHWRDYAIDSLPGQALFSVYRSAYEPDFVVAKQIAANGKGREFVVYQGQSGSCAAAAKSCAISSLRERARLRLRSF